MQQAEQWRCAELSLEDTQASRTTESGLCAIFTAPSGNTITREAFWDGGSTFRIRYALTEPGIWHYRLEGGDKNGTTGELECIPYRGTLPLYQHGFLKVGPRGRYLCHADNTPFFWLGDTHWHFAIAERWAESNDPRFDSQFRAIVDRRIQQKFTVYQCNFHAEAMQVPEGKDKYFAKADGKWVPKLDFLQKDLDQKMAYLSDSGLCIAAGFSWFFSVFAPDAKDYYQMAARYLIARYGAYPMIWTLAGEVGGYNEAARGQCIAFWREIAKTVEQYDGYHHLQTAHYTNERPFADYYHDEPWFDFSMNQAGHGDYPIDCRPYRAHRAKYPAKPFIESESMYENVLTLEINGRRTATPAMLRRVAYLAIQNGACGYTYGAQGMWHIQWDEPTDDSASLGFGKFDPWFRGIDFPGADQMTLMRDFYESVGWYRLRPLSPAYYAQDAKGGFVLTLTQDDMQALMMPSVQADDDMRTLVAYYSEVNRFAVRYTTLTQPSYKAYWFDPATGEKTLISDAVHPEQGCWTAPAKATSGDTLLVVTAQE